MYYKVSILGGRLRPLVYFSSSDINPLQIVKVPLKSTIKNAVVLSHCDKPEFKTEKITEITNEYFTTFQGELASFISHYYVCELGVAFGIFTPISSQNFLARNFEKRPNLSQKQSEAYEFCKQNRVSLIFGDTGSGKSEIYISLINDALNLGKQALFLMPEISLTPQMTKRLKAYFGDSLGVWHSKITKKKKDELITNLQNGQIRVIAGARSALFLPYKDLGQIIIDEEHDDSYKSDQAPRYNARDLGLYIANKFDIPITLGSATPSLTSVSKHPTFRLKGTYFDSQKSYIFDNNPTEISPLITRELHNCLKNGNQAIIFLPTRANFKYLICKSCGEMIKCPFCSIAMSLHKDKNMLKCHYCGHTEFFGKKCQKCGSDDFYHRKIGTNELIGEFKAQFPNAKFMKFDRDEITTQTKLEKILNDFNSGKIDVLIGTQMLSKGHDYHNVRLAVIMGLDDMLGYADFRAKEKTLALAIQLCGRAGRNGEGKVIIQSLQSDFFKAYIDDFDGFLEDEKYFRNPLYPPYTRLLRVLISDKSDKKAQNIMELSLARLKTAPNVQIVGYGKAGIEYIASKFRYEILLRSKSYQALINAANLCDTKLVQIDMDPANFS